MRRMNERATEYPVKRIIFASGLGTMIEWYDFYIFGSLAAIISAEFYPAGNEVVNFLKTLATFIHLPLAPSQGVCKNLACHSGVSHMP